MMNEVGELTEKNKVFVAVCEAAVKPETFEYAKWKGIGRPPVDHMAVYKAFLFKAVHDVPTMKEMIERVRVLTGGSSSSNFCLFPKRPSNVSATWQNYSTAKVVVSWTGIADAQGYEVWRSATKDFSSGVTKVADVTTTSYTDTNVSYRSPYSYMILAKYADGSRLFSPIYVYGYWGDWCLADAYRDLMPLRNLLTTIEYINPDGVLADGEINKAINDPNFSNIDNDPTTNSPEELDVYNRIKTLNADKNLISSVMRGDYTYRNMTRDQMIELQAINDKILAISR